MTDYYVIQQGFGTSRGDRTEYWSNTAGFTDLENATVYTLDEINAFQYLPYGSGPVVKLPTRRKSKSKAKL